jgi:hypothetical protein
LALATGLVMSEEGVTLEFLARQLRRVIDDIASLKDDMGVLTAMVVRHDQEFGRLSAKLDDMFNQMRAMVRQHQRFSERLRALEEEPR